KNPNATHPPDALGKMRNQPGCIFGQLPRISLVQISRDDGLKNRVNGARRGGFPGSGKAKGQILATSLPDWRVKSRDCKRGLLSKTLIPACVAPPESRLFLQSRLTYEGCRTLHKSCARLETASNSQRNSCFRSFTLSSSESLP